MLSGEGTTAVVIEERPSSQESLRPWDRIGSTEDVKEIQERSEEDMKDWIQVSLLGSQPAMNTCAPC